MNTYEDDATETGGTYESTGDEENAIHVSGGSVIFNQPTITRNSSTAQGGDTASFYGVGAAVLTTGGTSYINGGDIIALGTDMLETPTDASKQNTLALTFDETYKEGSTISVVKEDGTVIVTVSADQDFRTLLVSNAQLTEGKTYHVQIDGETISINGETDFVLTDTITSYGMGNQMGGPTDHPQGPGERPDGEPPARPE